MLIPVCFSELCTEESLFEERRGFYKVLFSPKREITHKEKLLWVAILTRYKRESLC